MLTPFGKYLRKLRIDRNELMKDMADKLKVTSSYLSAVEMGKKPVPDSWLPVLSKEYQLQSMAELAELAYESKPEFKFEVPKGSEDLRRKAAAVFARKVGDMDHESLERLLEVMLEKGECE